MLIPLDFSKTKFTPAPPPFSEFQEARIREIVRDELHKMLRDELNWLARNAQSIFPSSDLSTDQEGRDA